MTINSRTIKAQTIENNEHQKFGLAPINTESQKFVADEVLQSIPLNTRRESILSDNTTTPTCDCIDCQRAVVINDYCVFVICPFDRYVDVSINIRSDMFNMNVTVGEFVPDSVYYSFDNVTCLNVDRTITANSASVNITCLESALCTIQNAIKFTCVKLGSANTVLNDNNTSDSSSDSSNKKVVMIILVSVVALLCLTAAGVNAYLVSSYDDDE